MQKNSTEGRAVDGNHDHWIVECPNCSKEFEYEGYFDRDDVTNCPCGTKFKTKKVWINDERYIQ